MIGAAIRGGTRHRIRPTEGFNFLFSRRTRFSSLSPKKEPKLSKRNKGDLFILAVGICGALGYHLLHKDDDWDCNVWAVQTKLMASAAGRKRNQDEDLARGIASDNKALSSLQSRSFSDNLPPPIVLRYIEKALQPQSVSSQSKQQGHRKEIHDTTASISGPQHPIVTVHQSGEFFASHQWYPFEATMMALASLAKPGFVWDAQTTILNLSNRILEYYITNQDENYGNKPQSCSTESGIITKVWGKYPLIQVEEEDPYVLFWLAMTPLFPEVFLSLHHEPRILKWKDNSVVFNTESARNDRKRACASAGVDDGSADAPFLVEFFFQEGGLLHKIQVTSPSLPLPWQAIYTNYERHTVLVLDGENDNTKTKDRNDLASQQHILIPSSIEIGKGEGDQYQAHFKIHNRHLSYKR